ncbi:NADPH-dependent FMN reductase [Burkholderia sp. AU31652]|uniref:flavodoxin family protein n=1 Tax=unclassified Burkholderia TaxID=2613784 RepID=UPI000B7A46EE|nr:MULTISPECIES: flavodoxin family protein [unclassified Burkholderia]OXI83276.1 NADPH-dependent FMN reductase [Burkholderia sp. AU31652]OXJ10815.1 NADPH-dependent FMN reductase [Burkholderia sp. HI2500]
MLATIVFDSGHGHTERQAQAVAEGVRRVPGAEVRLVAVADGAIPWETLAASDAIIFGSPTYNGSISSRLKKFMEDSTRPAWIPQAWRNKVAAGFTNSGAQHGDKLNSLMTMTLFAAQHGMIWVGLDLFAGTATNERNRIGGWLGAMAQSDDVSPELSPIASDLDTAAHLGQRVAELASRFAASA